MKRLKGLLFLTLCVMLCMGCNRGQTHQHKSIEPLFRELKNAGHADYIKLPPRLVKAYLKAEKTDNAMIELLGQSKEFIVMHLNKTGQRKVYKQAAEDIKWFAKSNHFIKIYDGKHDGAEFIQYFLSSSQSGPNELILVIDQDSLLSVYSLKGQFTRDCIEELSLSIHPEEFLRLNQKIRNE